MKKASVQKRPLPTRIKHQTIRVSLALVRYIDRRPMRSFFASVLLILILIVISNILTKPKPASVEATKSVKAVSIYRVGSAPTVTVSAQTRKSGVIQIVALSGGVIDKINVQEGSAVSQGDQLLGMSSNYKGDNTFSLQKQIAATQYQGVLATFPKQKETIEKQKELVEKTEDNSDEMRKITQESVNETQTLVNQNQEVLKLLQDSLQTAPADKVLGIKEQIIQYQASTNQTNQALRNAKYQGDKDSPPAKIASLTKEIAKKQFDVQLKQLQISLEVSRLSLALTSLNESLMFPIAPFAATIQRVFVKEKQQVNPGTPLFVLSQVAQDDPITAVAFVSADVAKHVSRIEPSTIHIGDTVRYQTIPSFVSTDAVQGTLYAVYYPIPEQYSKDVVSDGFISIDIPIGMADTTMIATYIPLDAVYQTREKAYVFVVQGDSAVSRDIQLGQVYGDSVGVIAGIKNGDTVILNRNIIAGDTVQIQ